MSTPFHVHLDELSTILDRPLGPTPWRDITQEAVDTFADVTDDHQWIHVDPARAANGPFGGTIAHGYLTLSLVSAMIGGLLRVEGPSLTVNYGLEKVRFPAPVPVGTAVRATGQLRALDEVPGGVQGTMSVTVERDGGTKPVCVAEPVLRFYR